MLFIKWIRKNCMLFRVFWKGDNSFLSMPDEGYSEHAWWRLFWACLMKVVLSMPDEGCSDLHQACSEQPSSDMLRTTFIRHAQNNLHQTCSE
jgi:hypothetical protein